MRLFLKLFNYLIIICIIFLCGFLVGKKYDFTYDENNELVGLEINQNEQKIKRLVSLINDQYVNQVNTDSIVDNAIGYIINQLDPHSSYLNESLVVKTDKERKGEYIGIGLNYKILNDTLVVSKLHQGTINYGKLKFGDRILAVDNNPVTGEDLNNFAKLVVGKIGTNVNLTILRNNEVQDLILTRTTVPIPTVVATNMLSKDIGYIKLIRFADKSADEVHQSLQELLDKGMKKLVLDLRGNPGGIMRVAETIADEFLTKDELIVYTQDRDLTKKYIYGTNFGLFEKGQVYVLLDENSASSSEIVAGAMQDYGRATIVGRRSFGKGLVQREIKLDNQTRVRLTVANYFTPSGRSIQKSYDKGKEAYSDDILQRLKNGELYHKDSIKIDENQKFLAPSGKYVYGGGGIIPDVFVPLEVNSLRNWLNLNNDSNFFEDFLFKKADDIHSIFLLQNKNAFVNYFSGEIFREDFIKTINAPYNEFNTKNKLIIDNYIKSILAKLLFDTSVYYKIWNKYDPMILKVLELENENN